MNKTTCASAAAAAMLLSAVIASAACAQVLGEPSEAVSKPLSVKVGAFFPTSGTAQHNGGNVMVTAGLDYALAKTTSSNPALPSIYFDYEGGSRNGGHISTYGLGVAIRSYGTPPGTRGSSGAPYVGAGLGVYDEDGQIGRGGSNSKVNLGGKVFVGDEISGGYFIEANYQILSSVAGINPSGFGVQVGMRF